MAKADRISGIFWLIFSVFMSYESYKLGLGSLRKPGPGFLFFWTCIVIGILSVTIILRLLRRRPPDETKDSIFEKWNVAKIVLVLVSLFLYALLMERLGFFIVTLLLFTFLLGVIEKKRWPLTIMISLIVTAISYLIFELGLQSQLPKGVLNFLRF
ncbi:MAG: tripartite tricarboxylate transporter TctB family protein [Deltaproteobacteria bacterium]|nr:tripartite tricarboxylate transporter TctB family protein [Deltaproteobacteria bacterium]